MTTRGLINSSPLYRQPFAISLPNGQRGVLVVNTGCRRAQKPSIRSVSRVLCGTQNVSGTLNAKVFNPGGCKGAPLLVVASPRLAGYRAAVEIQSKTALPTRVKPDRLTTVLKRDDNS